MTPTQRATLSALLHELELAAQLLADAPAEVEQDTASMDVASRYPSQAGFLKAHCEVAARRLRHLIKFARAGIGAAEQTDTEAQGAL